MFDPTILTTLAGLGAAVGGTIVGFYQRWLERKAATKVEEAEKRAYSLPTSAGVTDERNDRKNLDLPALFDLYSKQIAKYQVETRFRAVWSFVWAVVAMVGGLTVLLIGVWHVFNEHEYVCVLEIFGCCVYRI